MEHQTLARVAIEGSVSAAQCALLRDSVEGSAFERSGFPLHAVPMPGVEFYQLDSETFIVTYMVIGDDVYCYEAWRSGWKKMRIRAAELRRANKLVEKVA